MVPNITRRCHGVLRVKVLEIYVVRRQARRAYNKFSLNWARTWWWSKISDDVWRNRRELRFYRASVQLQEARCTPCPSSAQALRFLPSIRARSIHCRPTFTNCRSYRHSCEHIIAIAIAVIRTLIQHLPIVTSASNECREPSSGLTSKSSEAHPSCAIACPSAPPARHAWPGGTKRPPPLPRGSVRESTRNVYR